MLRNQKEEDRLTKSRIIQDKLLAMDIFRKADIILFYASFDGEVETFELMRQAKEYGKKIILPKIVMTEKKIIPSYVENLNSELENGPYGIKQPRKDCLRPVDLRALQLLIVPGVAFDRDFNRLGRGGGYYDRLLASCSPEIPRIGLGFDFQLLDCLPDQKPHDVRLSSVVTN